MTLGPQFSLYHGSGAIDLKVGDVIEPRGGGGVAYATTDRSVAEKQAAIGYKKADQGRLFGKVYKVEPIGETETPDIHTTQRTPSNFKNWSPNG
jgi:hypothetical protein